MVSGPDQPVNVDTLPNLRKMLERYSEILEPWATNVTQRMLNDVSDRDEKAWATYTHNMSTALRQEIKNAPTGVMLKALLAEQVKLIKSIPLEAAQRVHDMTQEALVSGARYPEIAAKILETSSISKNRANLIARTEVARTASGLTQARALHIGAETYIWRTSSDEDVRLTHRAMANKTIRWDTPPLVEPKRGLRYHAGCFCNCRCWPCPIIPDRYLK